MDGFEIDLDRLATAERDAEQAMTVAYGMTETLSRASWGFDSATTVPGLDDLANTHSSILGGAIGSAAEVLHTYARQVEWMHRNLGATRQNFAIADAGFASGLDDILNGTISKIADLIEFPTRPDPVFDDFSFPTPSAGGSSLEGLSFDFASTNTAAFYEIANLWRDMESKAHSLANDLHSIKNYIADDYGGDVIVAATNAIRELADASDAFADNAKVMAYYADNLISIHAAGQREVDAYLAEVAAVEDPIEARALEKALLSDFLSYFDGELTNGVPNINNLMGVGKVSPGGASGKDRGRALENRITGNGRTPNWDTPKINGSGNLTSGGSGLPSMQGLSGGAGAAGASFANVDAYLNDLKSIGAGQSATGFGGLGSGSTPGGVGSLGNAPAPGLAGGAGGTGTGVGGVGGIGALGSLGGGSPRVGASPHVTRPVTPATPRHDQAAGGGTGAGTPGVGAGAGVVGGVGAAGPRAGGVPGVGGVPRHRQGGSDGLSPGRRAGAPGGGVPGSGGPGVGHGGLGRGGMPGGVGAGRGSRGLGSGGLGNGGVGNGLERPGGSRGGQLGQPTPSPSPAPGGGEPHATGQGSQAKHPPMMGAPVGAGARGGAKENEKKGPQTFNDLEREDNLRALLGEPIPWTNQHLDFGNRPDTGSPYK
ncbi:hypothetical protein C1Y63_03150 [Corynebacterium sp. 13CS0277]|uniref:hypothetical protein n=1 Tax=Corynebacterium sp. 13CS0277 TaxID=2071994 RepID=UPI000D038D4D|nr:hypothetical protein [Corynebacterium sp. 13CS0277]PRQ12078.1 hypothetical protein C1Y63_03150 [Corynebacterium sp. 13CS0277]